MLKKENKESNNKRRIMRISFLLLWFIIFGASLALKEIFFVSSAFGVGLFLLAILVIIEKENCFLKVRGTYFDFFFLLTTGCLIIIISLSFLL